MGGTSRRRCGLSGHRTSSSSSMRKPYSKPGPAASLPSTAMPRAKRSCAPSGALRRGDGAGRLSIGGVAGIPQRAVERLRLPPDSPLVGKTLAATGLRTQTGALVLAVGRDGDEMATPGPHFRLAADDVLVVVGQPPQLRAAARLVAGDSAALTPL